jgi:hypothetical protein
MNIAKTILVTGVFNDYVKMMNIHNELIDEASRLPCPDVQAWYSHNYA